MGESRHPPLGLAGKAGIQLSEPEDWPRNRDRPSKPRSTSSFPRYGPWRNLSRPSLAGRATLSAAPAFAFLTSPPFGGIARGSATSRELGRVLLLRPRAQKASGVHDRGASGLPPWHPWRPTYCAHIRAGPP